MSKILNFDCTANADDRMVFVLDGKGVDIEVTGPSVCLNQTQARELRDALAEHLGESAPAPFKENARFKDVRVGDTIRQTGRIGANITFARIGVVAAIDSTGWLRSEDDEVLANPTDPITILSRPTPELPTLAGSVIRLERDDVLRVGVATLGGDGLWRGTMPGGQGFAFTETKLFDQRGAKWDSFEVIA